LGGKLANCELFLSIRCDWRRRQLRYDKRFTYWLVRSCSGITNRSLRALVATRLPGYSPRQMTHGLHRVRRNGFLVRLERSNRYRLTAKGRQLAVFFAQTYARVVIPALAELDPALPARHRGPLSPRPFVAKLRAGP